MDAPVPKDPAFHARVQTSFDKQGLMRTLGASILHIAPGAVDIALSPNPAISQQHGFVHAGAVSSIADSAAGYAALSLMPPGVGVLTTEFKINYLAPVSRGKVVAESTVVSLTRSTAVVRIEVSNENRLVAAAQGTVLIRDPKK